MGRTLEEIMKALPAERQEAIEQGAAAIIDELGLAELRRARRMSQETIADLLHVDQSAVSKMERRTDMYISTVRHVIEAMGGQLRVIAEFPDRTPVEITQFGNREDESHDNPVVACR